MSGTAQEPGAPSEPADSGVDAVPGGTIDPLVGFRLRAVRVGTVLSFLTIAMLLAFTQMPGHGEIHYPAFWTVLSIAILATVGVALFPWKRVIAGPLGQWALYMWSAFDILLISCAVVMNEGAKSEVWVVYALPAIFFAAAYPRRGQLALLGLTLVGYVTVLAVDGWNISAAAFMLRVSFLVLVTVMATFLADQLRQEMERSADATLRAGLAESQARRAEWFRALVQDSSDIVTSFDVDGRILYISAAVRNLGLDPDALVGTNASQLVHPDDIERVATEIAAQFESDGPPVPIEYRVRHANGSFRYIEGVATNLLGEPTVNAVVVNARDVTERKRAELLLASQSDVLARIAAGDPLDVVLRLVTEIVHEHADALCTISVNGANDTQLMVMSTDPRARDDQPDDSDTGWSRDIVSHAGEVLGAVRLRFATPRFATNDDQQVAAVAASLAALAMERDAAEARLAHQARHDSLTGLANRQVFVNTLEHALTSARTHETIAVLFVDLDGFKEVNDNLGHHVGDQVLVALGHRLAGALRMHDVIARFGGDEFVALCRVDSSDHALYLADCILARVRDPLTVGSNRVNLDASIGVTLASLMADDGPRWVVNAAWVQAAADELLRQADTAMYRAKQAGGGRALLYGPDVPPRPHLRAAGDGDQNG